MIVNSTVSRAPSSELSKISGKISRYKKTREMANFFFTDRDRNIMGLSAIAGALAGAAGVAASTARDAANLREQADYVEMEINGQPAKGWVWFSPFQNGDEVELIGTQQDDHFEIIAIARPKDRVISLYPHCSRGKNAHIKNIIKWWLGGMSIYVFIIFPLIILLYHLISGESGPYLFQDSNYLYMCAAMYTLSGAFSFVNGKKFMMYVNAATQVFKVLNLNEPDNVNLPKFTKRKPGDPGAFGVMYFNY
ncbi:putative type VI secretion system effector [Chromobacterium rhizoryzae]|uniref:putative type VI secretion system effector n=1 Tax=Chromobacterium rhizoryzae TaxID=1778675 RepID=UPI001D09208F|nr:putative type VI secretion system effector [Chromobacterium rhizoryzae]